MNDLRAVVFDGVLDAAQAGAADGVDPAAAALADATATVRAAIASGNVLDADPTKVPRSLRGLTARTAACALMNRVQVALSTDQQTARQEDLVRLQRISEGRERFEQADVPAGAGEMQAGGGGETLVEGNRGHGRAELRGI